MKKKTRTPRTLEQRVEALEYSLILTPTALLFIAQEVAKSLEVVKNQVALGVGPYDRK